MPNGYEGQWGGIQNPAYADDNAAADAAAADADKGSEADNGAKAGGAGDGGVAHGGGSGTSSGAGNKVVEVVSATSGEDRYKVKVDGVQTIMGKAEIEAAGGTLAVATERQSKLSQIRVSQGRKQANIQEAEWGAQDMGMSREELTKRLSGNSPEKLRQFAHKYGMTLTEAVEAHQRWQANPDSREFENFNKWVISDFHQMDNIANMGTAQEVAWKVVNEANKEHPGIMGTEHRGATNINVINLELAVQAGIDRDTLNLIGASGAPMIVREHSGDSGEFRAEGWGVTSKDIARIKDTEQRTRELEADLEDMPEELQEAYAQGGLEGYNKAVDRHNKKFEAELSGMPEELQKAYRQGGIPGYNQAVATYNEKIEADKAAFEAELKDMPEELQEAYAQGGTEAYNLQVKAYNAAARAQTEAFEAELSGQPEELQEAYAKGGIDAYNLQVKAYNARRGAETEKALEQVEPYKTSEGYDLDKYVKEALRAEVKLTPGEGSDKEAISQVEAEIEQTLTRAGFDKEAISQAIDTARLSWGAKLWRGMTPWDEAKGETVTLKGGAEMAAESLVPGVWLKDVKDMKPWQIGLNAGLDLLILVPVAGWAARVGAKTLVRAGTATIAKSLGKELPKALIRIGQRNLARESITTAKSLKALEPAMRGLERAAKITAKTERAGKVDAFMVAVRNESAARLRFANQFRKVGADIATLDAKVGDTALRLMSREQLKKAIGMGAKADDFAEYVAGVYKEIARRGMGRSLPKKVGQALARQVKGYKDAVDSIKDLTVASAKTVRGGTRAGAASLTGQGKAIKMPTGSSATEAFVRGGREQVHKYLSGIEKQLGKDAGAAEARLAKYGGKKTLDKWDKYIRESWSPGAGGGSRVAAPVGAGSKEISPTELRRAGMSAGAGQRGGGARASARASARPGSALHSYTIPVTTIAGTRIFTVIVNPADGTVEMVPDTRHVTPEEPGREGSARPLVEPMTPAKPWSKPETKMEPGREPGKAPKEKTGAAVAPAAGAAPRAGALPGAKPGAEPGGEAKPQPETKPKPEEPIKPKTTVTTKEPIRPKVIIIAKPGKDDSDKKKRKFLEGVEGIVARRRGQLRGKDVILVRYAPWGEDDKMVLLGKPPKGMKSATGKGSVKASATLIRGKAPPHALRDDTGAVDDIIIPKGKRGIIVRHVKDTEPSSRGSVKPPKRGVGRVIDIGAGLEANKKGRRHIKLT